MFITTDTQYLAAGTIVRVDGFTGTITNAAVELDEAGIAGWPTYTITAARTGEVRTITVGGVTQIEIPV